MTREVTQLKDGRRDFADLGDSVPHYPHILKKPRGTRSIDYAGVLDKTMVGGLHGEPLSGMN